MRSVAHKGYRVIPVRRVPPKLMGQPAQKDYRVIPVRRGPPELMVQ